jgi:hypothetical protein
MPPCQHVERGKHRVNWDAVVTRNRAALTAIVAGLIAMAGWTEMPAPGTAALPCRLRLAILRLLLPAESAVRRLVIIASRGLAVSLPPVLARSKRPAAPKPVLVFWQGRMVPPARIAALAAAGITSPHAMPARPPARTMAFQLFDPPKRFGRRRRRPFAAAPSAPRVVHFDGPFRPLPRPPLAIRADGLVGSARLALRLAAVRAALCDIPHQARRLAVREARAASEQAHDPGAAPGRRHRPPCRIGRPPGHRRRRTREVDAILADCDTFAREAGRRSRPTSPAGLPDARPCPWPAA